MIDKEPKTFEDLWLMCETSEAWFYGALRFENVRNGADPEVGAVDSVYWRVVPTSDCVRVRRDTHVICDVKDSGKSFSCRVEGETVAEYRSIDDFRASEWWDLTMKKFAGGDADASWPSYPDGTLVMTGDNVQVYNVLGRWQDDTVEGIEFRQGMNGKQFVKISYKGGCFPCDSVIDMPSNTLADGKPAHIGDKVKHVKCSDVMEVVCNSFGEVFVRDSNGSEYYVNPDSLVHVVPDSVDKLIKDLESALCSRIPECGYFCHTAEDGQQSCDHCPSADVSDKTCSQVFLEDVLKRIKELMKDGVE